MDRNQRKSLANLLDAHAWYVATASDDFSNQDFEEAKAEFVVAKQEFINCEPEQPIKVEVVNLSKGAPLL